MSPLASVAEAGAPIPVVVDSSVAVKWFVRDREADVQAAEALLREHRDRRIALHAPTHLRLEVLNALLARGWEAEALAEVSDLMDACALTWLDADAPLCASACAIAVQESLTIYDALFAAAAALLDAPLITANRSLSACGACRTELLGS